MKRSLSTRLLIVSLTFALCGLPEAIAQNAKPLPDAPSHARLMAVNMPAPQNPDVAQTQDPAQAQSTDPQQPAQQSTDQQPRVVPVDPQKAPGTEDPSQPDAATQSSQDTSATNSEDQPRKVIAPADPAELQQLESAQQENAPENKPVVSERVNPLGTAAAEKGKTAGGGASRPAGVAIAPAKQKRSRSLLIKVGAALAAGAAIGTVYGLSRSTKSTPAGAIK